MNASISMHFRLPYRVEREGDVYVSICDLLDVQSQGATSDEAGKMLNEALQLFLETCIEAGTVDAVLRDSGFSLVVDGQNETSDDPGYLDVPVSLLLSRNGRTDHAC